MVTEPYIYSKNYVNSDDVFTVSSGAAAISNAYDRDNVSQWLSSGANSDSTPVTIQIAFYEGTVAATRTFDTFLMVNHNIKNYTVAWWTGSAWTTFITQTNDTSQSNTSNVSTYGNTPTALNTFSPVTTTQILITANTTQTANQEKAIGEIVACNTQLAIGLDFWTYTVQFRQKVKDLALGDGSMHRAVIHWTSNRIEKYEASVSFHLLPEATKLALLTIKQNGLPFLWYPEGVTKPDEIWYVHWYDPRTYQYSNYVKSAGLEFSMQLKEV